MIAGEALHQGITATLKPTNVSLSPIPHGGKALRFYGSSSIWVQRQV